jgi:apolipoprotein N-acyltransferase
VNWLLAVASAALLVLCFPPYHAAWLAPFALIPLLTACWRERRGARRFGYGYLAGVIYWFGVCHWIQFTLASHAGVGEAGGWALFVLFCLAKALQTATFAWLAGYARDFPAPPLFLAALWVAIEYTHAPLGFAWLMLGNAAIDWQLPLRLAPVTGVWGISFLFALTAASLALVVLRRPRHLAWLAVWPALILLPAMTKSPAPGRQALLVQPNVDESELFTAISFAALRQKLAAMSLGPLLDHSHAVDIVVWPEIPAPLLEGEANFTDLERQVTTAGHVWFLTGLLGQATGNDVYNSAALGSFR